jgi:hypothetical protein
MNKNENNYHWRREKTNSLRENSSSVTILLMVVHFVFRAEKFSAQTSEWISSFCVHDGGVGA